jgi:hypothetical protein
MFTSTINLENNQIKTKYGVLIILISILTRTFVVSFAWSYGVFLVALKKNYPDSYFFELGKCINYIQ